MSNRVLILFAHPALERSRAERRDDVFRIRQLSDRRAIDALLSEDRAYGAYALGLSGYSEVLTEFNGGPGNPGGAASARSNLVPGQQTMGAWAGQPCNPYDTERVPRGSSGGQNRR